MGSAPRRHTPGKKQAAAGLPARLRKQAKRGERDRLKGVVEAAETSPPLREGHAAPEGRADASLVQKRSLTREAAQRSRNRIVTGGQLEDRWIVTEKWKPTTNFHAANLKERSDLRSRGLLYKKTAKTECLLAIGEELEGKQSDHEVESGVLVLAGLPSILPHRDSLQQKAKLRMTRKK